DYGSTPKDSFEKEKTETQSHYSALLTMQKEQTDAIIVKHDTELEFPQAWNYPTNAKLELLDHIIAKSVPKSNKENLESEIGLAEEKMADVKVPYIDWYKLGEPHMYD
ncbi:unnamed protein product, partial [Brassica oleracea var. botrytis]